MLRGMVIRGQVLVYAKRVLASIAGKLKAKAPQIVLGEGEEQGLVVIFSVIYHQYPVVGTE